MLDIHKRDVGKIVILSLNGDLDLDGAQNLRSYLSTMLMEKAQKVVIDWKDVSRVSFTSVQLVTRSMQELVKSRPLAFCGMSDIVQKSLRTTPFFDKVKLFETEDRALSRF